MNHTKCCPYCGGGVFLCESDLCWRCDSCPEEWSFEEEGYEHPSAFFREQGALQFKEELLRASSPIIHPHIEGVFSVFQRRRL
jgi:hypothetical protein